MPTSFQYHRLRAPSENGQTLQDPPLASASQMWQDNLRIERTKVDVGGLPLSELSQLGRTEVFDLAVQHTRQYRDVSTLTRRINLDQVVMSGHQPQLFHPGVWYKNFCLSKLGQQLQATALNIVVDNDICGVAAIRVPARHRDSATIKMVHFDAAGDNVPFEVRPIEDAEVFGMFGQRVKEAISPLVEKPLVEKLWKLTEQFRTPEMRMGEALAIGRHALELDFGLKTLEVPLSQISQTRAFAQFAFQIIDRREEFREIYNRALREYRELHKIRSNSHPVPPLELNEGWCEVPLWIWDANQPIRRRLFSQANGKQLELTDRRDIRLTIDQQHFVEQFSNLSGTGLAIRPRALATTMYSRLVLSDLFLHGIGGAKYDQLTDVIARDFFGIELPSFITLTATLKLPLHYEPVFLANITRMNQHLRELTFHPEKHVSETSDQFVAIANRKRKWIQTQLPPGERLERHQAIVQCNAQLQPFVQAQLEAAEQRRGDLSAEIRTSQILGSREFSFCLFPIELMQQLKQLAE